MSVASLRMLLSLTTLLCSLTDAPPNAMSASPPALRICCSIARSLQLSSESARLRPTDDLGEAATDALPAADRDDGVGAARPVFFPCVLSSSLLVSSREASPSSATAGSGSIGATLWWPWPTLKPLCERASEAPLIDEAAETANGTGEGGAEPLVEDAQEAAEDAADHTDELAVVALRLEALTAPPEPNAVPGDDDAAFAVHDRTTGLSASGTRTMAEMRFGSSTVASDAFAACMGTGVAARVMKDMVLDSEYTLMVMPARDMEGERERLSRRRCAGTGTGMTCCCCCCLGEATGFEPGDADSGRMR
jgi:hypothetical protein